MGLRKKLDVDKWECPNCTDSEVEVQILKLELISVAVTQFGLSPMIHVPLIGVTCRGCEKILYEGPPQRPYPFRG